MSPRCSATMLAYWATDAVASGGDVAVPALAVDVAGFGSATPSVDAQPTRAIRARAITDLYVAFIAGSQLAKVLHFAIRRALTARSEVAAKLVFHSFYP